MLSLFTWKRNVWSVSFLPLALSAAKMPASATLAVPWMSSLKVQYLQYSTVQYSTVQYSTVQYSKGQYNKVQYLSRYFSNSRNALFLPKSLDQTSKRCLTRPLRSCYNSFL